MRRKVLLIGWDAADWEHINPLLDAGEMPALEGLINGGVMGNLATLQPVLSPMLWNSVATGKYAYKHGIHGFIEPDTVNGGARPATSHSRRCRALWNMLTLEGLRSNVVGWWASHPAEAINGVVVTNSFKSVKYNPQKGWTYPHGTFHPEPLADDLAKFRILPSELTQEHLLPFIPNAAQIDQTQDQRLGQFASTLAETGSIQAVATALMELEDWDLTAIYFDCIDHLCHGFMRYYPPRHPDIPEADFEMYKDVIAGAYRFHDMMLERQLQLAGPDTTVILCSDHGFESGHLRKLGFPREPAGPANDHRDMGIIVINGPGIRRDERIYGASLIDIAPTILTIMGLPIGEDMDGRPLLEAFEDIPRPATIPSWDELPGDCGRHDREESLSQEQSDELMQQFAALGYIDDPDKDKATLAEDAEIEQKYNLARHYMWLRKHDEAVELYRQIVEKRPWETRFLAQLAECFYRAGYFRQAIRLLETSFDLSTNRNVSVLLTLGKALIGLGETEAGIERLRQVEQLRVAAPGIFLQLGDHYIKLRRFEDAERNLKAALLLDPEHAMAWQGLSTVYCRRRQNAEAADAALKAVGLVHRLPKAHFNLGIALARTKNFDRAIVAFETVLQFRPNHYNAHRWLARLYRMQDGATEKFIQHYAAIERARSATKQETGALRDRAELLFELPPIPDEQERLQILLKERPDAENPLARVDKTFVLVSGLPRSGTSLMMQMLEAGGLPAHTDGNREADENNPRGYFEWEELKQIGRYRNLLDEEGLEDRAIKAVSAVIQKMPRKYKYKVIFMVRPVDEIAISQNKMLDRGKEDTADLGDLAEKLERHRDEVLTWLQKADNVECLLVDYPTLVSEPELTASAVAAFLGEKLTTPDAMVGPVDPALYRNRVEVVEC